MRKRKQKRRPERDRPGLKALTPAERKIVAECVADMRKRWEHLFGLNRHLKPLRK